MEDYGSGKILGKRLMDHIMRMEENRILKIANGKWFTVQGEEEV